MQLNVGKKHWLKKKSNAKTHNKMKNITPLPNFPIELKNIFLNAYKKLPKIIDMQNSYKIFNVYNSEIFNEVDSELLETFDIAFIGFFAVNTPYKPHIDRSARAALNIPAYKCKDGIAYAAKPTFVDEIVKSGSTNMLPDGALSEFSFNPIHYDFFSQNIPYFLNTAVPHGGHNSVAGVTRKFWSLRFSYDHTYQDIVNKYSNWA